MVCSKWTMTDLNMEIIQNINNNNFKTKIIFLHIIQYLLYYEIIKFLNCIHLKILG